MLRFTVGETVYDWDDDHVLNTEAIALKKASGLTTMQLMEGISEFDAEALTAMVWLAKRRAGETEADGKPLRMGGLEFDLGGLDLHMVDENGDPVRRTSSADGEAEDPTPPSSDGSVTS